MAETLQEQVDRLTLELAAEKAKIADRDSQIVALNKQIADNATVSDDKLKEIKYKLDLLRTRVSKSISSLFPL